MKRDICNSISVGFLAVVIIGFPAAAFAEGWQPLAGHIMTPWSKDVNPNAPLPDYPRPQMVRAMWQSLNGLWDFALTPRYVANPPTNFSNRILVPFPYESALSGVGKPSIPDQRIWYRRIFSVPEEWAGQRVLLHFGAVNWDSSVFVNGRAIGTHRGGFDGFEFDITDALRSGDNQLTVSAANPLSVDCADAQVVGKQRLHPDGIFYTASTGIWQSVWLEPVPVAHISTIKLVPDIDAGLLRVTVNVAGNGTQSVLVTANDGDSEIASARGVGGTELTIPIAHAHLWSTDDPHLYGLRVAVLSNKRKSDQISSYFAMRKVSIGKDAQGRNRILLNNHFVPEIGALDQGYWPDGIYTAPTDDALKSDIVVAKGLGFNLLRKHAKVEPDRWYYWTDKLGMLVWQDMPQCFDKVGPNHLHTLSAEAKAQWLVEWKRILTSLINHPSIIVWTTFNEAWGQHDTEEIAGLTKQLDPNRLVNAASGWDDERVGDIHDTHAYPGPWSEQPDETRAAVNGECGGLTMRIADHAWTTNLFGYGASLRSAWKITQKYQKLLQTAYRLRDERGTSAFVYTQLTDVEQECNGLLTYDRKLIKPLAVFIAAANRGQFPALPPAPVSNELLATSAEEPHDWSFTTQTPGVNWAKLGFDDSSWKIGPAPFGQGYASNTRWADTPGDIWIRRKFQLPDAVPSKLMVRTIHDEGAEVYFNGVLAASAVGFVGDYVELPVSDRARAALKPGQNVIAAHCHQSVGGQVIDVGISPAP